MIFQLKILLFLVSRIFPAYVTYLNLLVTLLTNQYREGLKRCSLGSFLDSQFFIFASSVLNGTVGNSSYILLVDCVKNSVFKMMWRKVVTV
jgi:hypothetical protein